MNRKLLKAWDRTVERYGNSRALVQASDGSELTFAELDARAGTWVEKHLQGFRSVEGTLALFGEPNGARWFEVFLGLLKGGAVAAPIDPSEPVAGQQALARRLRAVWWNGLAMVELENPRRMKSAGMAKLTSGTTGAPRPLFFTDDQILADGRQVMASMGIRRSDLNYGLIPFGHSYGLGNLAIPLVMNAVPIVSGSAPLPHAVAEDFRRWHPTVFPGVPALFKALAASDAPRESFAGLRLAISAGSPLAAETAKAFHERFGIRLHAFYGSSETGGISFDRSGKATLLGQAGRPLKKVQVSALRGGRIRVRSAAVFSLGNPDRRNGQGAWIPADRVRVGPKAGLTLLGRTGSVVKIAGRRVSLPEIAESLRMIEGVEEVWVGASETPDQAIAAAVVTARSVDAIRSELQARIAGWKVPKKWLKLCSLPLTSRGKTDSVALRKQFFGS